MKLDFNKKLTDLAGADVIENNKPIYLGQLLGNCMAAQAKGDVLKFFTWAMDLYNGRLVDLDKSDQETLKKFISDSEAISILAKGQLYKVFDKPEK